MHPLAASIVFCLLFQVSTLVTRPAQAQDSGFWTFLTPGTVQARCAESSLPYQDARARLDRLDEYVARLADAPNDTVAIGELRSLLTSECFRPAAESDRIATPDSTAALKKWWTDGGLLWLESYLELPELGDTRHLRRHIVLPPDTRSTLAIALERDDPLRALICRVDDATCGVETLGWVDRAERAFEAHRIAHADDNQIFVKDSFQAIAATPEAASQRCAADLPDGTNATRYQAWRDCLDRQRPRTSALPVGRLKVPAAGWLIVSGRRGHYSFCDPTSAYDLASGAAFVHESCSGLALVPDGSVDRAQTDAARHDHVRSGRLSIDNLREAVWMLLLQPHVTRIQVKAEYYPLPEGLAPETVARSPTDDPTLFDSVTMSTAQTTLTWRWVPAAGREITGELVWPGSFDGAQDHASSLLNVAELSLIPGCVPRRAPPESLLGPPAISVNPIDAPPQRAFYDKVTAAYKQWARVPQCEERRRGN